MTDSQVIYSETKPLLSLPSDIQIAATPVGKHEGRLVYQDTIFTYKAMRRVNVRATSPIHRRYEWCGPYTPMRHQYITSAFLTLYDRAIVGNGIGTGKTLSVIWALDYLMQIGEIKRALVLTPLSTVQSVWADTLFQHAPHLKQITAHGALKRKITSTPNEFHDRQIILANHEATWDAKLRTVLLNQLRVDCVVVDEGSLFHNPQTNKFKGLLALLRSIPRVWWVTATPTPNSPVDAWAQMRALNIHKGIRYVEWRDLTMRPAGPSQSTPRANAADTVAKHMQPCIRFETKDCIDLPDLTYQTRQVEMTKTQIAAYKQLCKDAVLMTQSGQVTAVNAAVLMTKLMQIASGVVYTDNDGETAEIEPTHKLQELRDILDSTDEVVIVFAPFTSVIRYLAEKLKTYTLAVIDGNTSVSDRAKIIRDVQDGTVKVLLAHPRTTSHGLTLTRATAVVWWCPVHSNDTYEQANGRIYRQGQTKHCSVVHLASSDVERGIYERLKNKQSLQNSVLSLLARSK